MKKVTFADEYGEPLTKEQSLDSYERKIREKYRSARYENIDLKKNIKKENDQRLFDPDDGWIIWLLISIAILVILYLFYSRKK